MEPVRLSLPYWRLMLLAALVLLAGAMGDTAMGRFVAAKTGGVVGCASPDQDSNLRLTAPGGLALTQGVMRGDGKGKGKPTSDGHGAQPATVLATEVLTPDFRLAMAARAVASTPGTGEPATAHQARAPPAHA